MGFDATLLSKGKHGPTSFPFLSLPQGSWFPKLWADRISIYAWFCIAQATFGPTHSSLAELKGKESYEAWIVQQMALDAWFAWFALFSLVKCFCLLLLISGFCVWMISRLLDADQMRPCQRAP